MANSHAAAAQHLLSSLDRCRCGAWPPRPYGRSRLCPAEPREPLARDSPPGPCCSAGGAAGCRDGNVGSSAAGVGRGNSPKKRCCSACLAVGRLVGQYTSMRCSSSAPHGCTPACCSRSGRLLYFNACVCRGHGWGGERRGGQVAAGGSSMPCHAEPHGRLTFPTHLRAAAAEVHGPALHQRQRGHARPDLAMRGTKQRQHAPGEGRGGVSSRSSSAHAAAATRAHQIMSVSSAAGSSGGQPSSSAATSAAAH
jgi:hypothetical protein